VKILVSNDDGFRAEGIRRLREALATLDVACDTPKGPLSYGAKFAPQTPAGG